MIRMFLPLLDAHSSPSLDQFFFNSLVSHVER
jgi:hypothetical protein